MSAAYRNSLTPEQRILYDQACAAAGAVLSEARALRDSLPARQAAELAYVPGGLSIEELTALIEQHRAEARAAMDAGMAGAA